MSAWIDRIVQEFPVDVSRFWIACDLDDLLLDERILLSLRERGFEVLPFEDPIAFRTEYEERYRAAWDRGADGSAKALILQLQGSDTSVLPWDYIRDGRQVRLGLADLFPTLSYNIIRQMGSEYHEALFSAVKHNGEHPIGEGSTKDFILTRIFCINPYSINSPEDFWREVLRLHYRGSGLPDLLADHVSAILRETTLSELPVAKLLSSKSYLVRVVQDAWDLFLAQFGVQSSRSPNAELTEAYRTIAIPFEHPDVRMIVDTMFLEGTLKPVTIKGSPIGIPDWAKVGLISDPNALADLVRDAVTRISGELPGIDSSHRDWGDLARRLGEVIFRFHSLNASVADTLLKQFQNLQSEADERLKAWVLKHFADLSSLPAAKAPVMVHHVPRFLALRRSAGEDHIALLVFDGLAIDQWIQIREYLSERVPGFRAEDGTCFAWLPTLTSVSRQALFSGLKPREFAGSISTTSQEPLLWERFWQESGLRKSEIYFQKSLKRTAQLADLEDAIASPPIKVVGIVVDMVDEIVHGAKLGKRGIAGQISTWCDTGFVENLISMLARHGYQIYLTADHGNVEAEGVGRLNQGVVSEGNGERVRTYRSAALAELLPEGIEGFRFDAAGLPSDFFPLYAGTRGAFVPKGDQIVAHGGISVEEVIVPFVKITVARSI